MLHSKFVVSNIVKAVVITLLIFSCMPSTKADEVDTLIQKLKDKDSDVRRKAAAALGKIKDARTVEPLIAALKDWDLRFAAAEALGEIGVPAVELLIAALKDKDGNFRIDVARAFEEIGTRAVEPLIAALKDENMYVRMGAAMALGNIKDARAVEPLIAALKDGNSEAAAALGDIKDARAVKPLIAALKNDNNWVSSDVATALGEIGAPAVEPLIDALKDENWHVRKNAEKAFIDIRDTHAVEPLIAALKHENPNVRRNAAVALGRIKDTRAVEPLIAALKDENEDVRSGASMALGNIEDARAVEPLIAALKDKDCYVQRQAVGALGDIGVPSVIKALKDSKRAVNTLEESLVYWDFPAAKMLSSLGWIPESDSDRIHFWVGLRNSEKLKENWNTTKDVLLKDVKSNNCLTIENALYAFIAIGKSEIIPVLIETLNTAGNKTMAEAYLNCGHSGLADAAKDWAWRHGYSISTGSGNAPVGWGQW